MSARAPDTDVCLSLASWDSCREIGRHIREQGITYEEQCYGTQ